MSERNGASVSLQWNLALNHECGPTLRTDSAAVGLVTVRTDAFRSEPCRDEQSESLHGSRHRLTGG